MAQFRNTAQKEEVYSALVRLADHPTADEVYDFVHLSAPKISRATVYRVLNQLAESGQALRVAVPGGAARFDHRTMPHDHVRCTVCGKVCDVIDGPELSIDYSRVSAMDFKITGHSIIFDGLCRQCEETAE